MSNYKKKKNEKRQKKIERKKKGNLATLEPEAKGLKFEAI